MEENIAIDHYIDLCGFDCPINFVKCCLALEKMSSSETLKVDLDTGEAEESVSEGLKQNGYKVKIIYKDIKKVTMIISSV